MNGGVVELRTSLGVDDAVSRSRVGQLPPGWVLEFREVDERPAETWREFVRPIEVNDRLVIRPAWCDAVDRPGVLDVSIEPGGSFGLGDHPTTRLSADAVDALTRPGDRVADVGCGSGVLAVIAALRGAAVVTAIDIAEPAREATVDNADRNGVGQIVQASTRTVHELRGTYDLVVANILAPTLVQIAPDLRRITDPGGRLVVSGVLADGYDHVLDALVPMAVVDTAVLDGWAAVTLGH
jgi:ribosomal protein L11 methyltransferase